MKIKSEKKYVFSILLYFIAFFALVRSLALCGFLLLMLAVVL